MDAVVMFDFDGVIADSLEVFFPEFSAVCSEMGFDRINSREAFLKLFNDNLLKGLVKAGFPIWKLKRLAKAFGPRIAEANERVLPFAEMPELLNELTEEYPVYIITSNATEAITNFLTKYEIHGVRDVLGADKEASKVKKIKRISRLYPYTIRYYIGDTRGDMLEGRAAGAITIAATWGWHPEESLMKGRPDHLVTTPHELRGLFL